MQIELTEIVDKLIGTYTPHGDSGIDHKAMEHLKEVEGLLYHILQKLVDNAQQKNSYEGSVADIGKKSYDILMECKEYIKEVEDKDYTKINEAIAHYQYGINCDIFKEPITSYAKLAVTALEEMRDN